MRADPLVEDARAIGCRLEGMLLAGLATVLVLVADAVDAAPPAQPMRFAHLTLEAGLSQSAVVSILQDADGYMWFGTENGLNRYDGYEFDHFRRERGNPDALASDFIYDIARDADGLWVATNGGGLAHWDKHTERFRNYRHDPSNRTSIAGNVVRKLLVADDGTIWLGLRDAGLDRFDPRTGAFDHYDFAGSDGKPGTDSSVYALHEDTAGLIWIGSDAGLYRLDPESGEVRSFRHHAQVPSTISEDRIRAIAEDSNRTLWVGTYSRGLNRFDAESESFVRYLHDSEDPTSLSDDRITVIREDADRHLWVGTTRGLNLHDAETDTFVRYGHDAGDSTSLGSDAISSLYQDRSGMLWVGTLTAGISKWNPRSWDLGLHERIDPAAGGEAEPNVTAFATAGGSTVWIGTFGNGLKVLNRDDGTVTSYRHDTANASSLSDDRIMSLLMARDGSLWIGTMTGGLNRMNPVSGDNVVFRHDAADPNSIGADGIMALYEDRGGRIWAGTFGGGVSVYLPGRGAFGRYDADPANPRALSSSRVTSFAEDPSGRLWIGTDAGGLNLLDPETGAFRRFRYDPEDPRSLSDDTVYSLHVDAAGVVWVGTRGGLDRVDGRATDPDGIQFTNLSTRDGLTNDVIYGIHSDDAGHLWLSTNYGIDRLDPRSGAIRSYHRRDGLQSDEFNFGAHHRGANGELFFGGHKGFNVFDPSQLRTNALPPPVVLTGFLIGNERSRLASRLGPQGIDVGYREANVGFEFAALDYTAPQNNHYMYKLEGLNDEWVDLGNRRRMTFGNLAHGAYLLRVRGANSDGTWNENGFVVPLKVAPPPWETWWAYLGYVGVCCAMASALWLGHRRKLRREEEYSRRLEHEVQDRTAELAERNRELSQVNRSLQESTLTDPLTGLRNRRFVFEEMPRDLATIKRRRESARAGLDPKLADDLVFMMIDLDQFKPINDTYGHAAGDEVLLGIRDVLLHACRQSDFVVRWGGDEFVFIAKHTRATESQELAERIRRAISSKTFEMADGSVVSTTCSIGFVAFPLFPGQAENANIDNVINLADRLMYEAKRQRNAWIGMLSMNEAVVSENVALTDLDPSSLLFRAQREGRVYEYRSDAGDAARRATADKAG